MAARKSNLAPPAKGSTSLPDELDLKLAKGWQTFRNGMIEYLENSTATVDLQFESSVDEKTHYNFAPDEVVFVNDVKVAPSNIVIFTVVFGDKDKAFRTNEAELIVVEHNDGDKTQLSNVINSQFRDAFKEIPDCSTVMHLERKYLKTYPELSEVFNDVDVFISNYEANKNKGTLYEKIDLYGIF
jgi:hypothetical protein